MRLRHVATGTLLATSLLLGGGSLAAADGAPPAVTQGAFPCVQVEARLVGLHRAVDAMAAHQARIAARLAAAVANGNTARAHRLERQAAHLTTVQGRFAARVAGLDAAYAENCTPDPGPDA